MRLSSRSTSINGEIPISKLYELHDAYADLRQPVGDDVIQILRSGMTPEEFVDRLRPLLNRLSILLELHRVVENNLSKLVE